MNYKKIEHLGWIAVPTNWEELSFTVNNEEGFMSYDPNDFTVTPEAQLEADAWD